MNESNSEQQFECTPASSDDTADLEKAVQAKVEQLQSLLVRQSHGSMIESLRRQVEQLAAERNAADERLDMQRKLLCDTLSISHDWHWDEVQRLVERHLALRVDDKKAVDKADSNRKQLASLLDCSDYWPEIVKRAAVLKSEHSRLQAQTEHTEHAGWALSRIIEFFKLPPSSNWQGIYDALTDMQRKLQRCQEQLFDTDAQCRQLERKLESRELELDRRHRQLCRKLNLPVDTGWREAAKAAGEPRRRWMFERDQVDQMHKVHEELTGLLGVDDQTRWSVLLDKLKRRLALNEADECRQQLDSIELVRREFCKLYGAGARTFWVTLLDKAKDYVKSYEDRKLECKNWADKYEHAKNRTSAIQRQLAELLGTREHAGWDLIVQRAGELAQQCADESVPNNEKDSDQEDADEDASPWGDLDEWERCAQQTLLYNNDPVAQHLSHELLRACDALKASAVSGSKRMASNEEGSDEEDADEVSGELDLGDPWSTVAEWENYGRMTMAHNDEELPRELANRLLLACELLQHMRPPEKTDKTRHPAPEVAYCHTIQQLAENISQLRAEALIAQYDNEAERFRLAATRASYVFSYHLGRK